MLSIKNLNVTVADKKILNGISLNVPDGEIHVIMGPNGSGKSTLAHVLAGSAHAKVQSGSIVFDGKDVLKLSPEKRAHLGIFLAFQYPTEIPGLGNAYFMKAALNALRKSRGEKELDAMEFLTLARKKIKELHLPESFLQRSVNVGFSGGEKKRNEMLQLALLEPKLAILDETDSGLDIDALKIVAQSINAMRSKKRSFLIITHYPRLFEFITPDRVHIMKEGRVSQSGGIELIAAIEKSGFTEAKK
jgi:Fe-S cluster assembly ATP-binding protein